jgi:hypothetical protein
MDNELMKTHHRICAGILALAMGLTFHVANAADDRDELLALHKKVLKAHLESNVEILLEDESSDYVVGSQGELTRPTIEERRARLGPYLASTTFSSYVDLVPPVVRVSADGSMGWVMVQVEATGVQKNEKGEKEPLQFVCAWIELYEKRDGTWYRTGNVSNFKS